VAFNPFLGWSREDLEGELRAAQEDYAAGKATTKVGAGDASTESRVEVSTIERVKALYRALNAIAPDDYPIEQITAIDRTRGTFWGADPIWPWP
jgi:hypothetical protein